MSCLNNVFHLSMKMRTIDESMRPSFKRQQVEDDILSDLRVVCNKIKDLKQVTVVCFGSSRNGWMTENSDVDVLITLRQGDEISNLKKIKNTCYPTDSKFKIRKVILKAKVPIVTLTHKVSGTELDISMQSQKNPRDKVIHNTELLYKYSIQNDDIVKVYR